MPATYNANICIRGIYYIRELKNGAKLLAQKPRTNNPGWVVLAYNEGAVQPYVTWVMDQHDDCVWGHYFRELAHAQKDFEERT